MKKCFGAWLAAAALTVAAAEPLWDLDRDPVTLKTGTVEKSAGGVKLDGKNSFAIPAEIFKGRTDYVVEVTVKTTDFPVTFHQFTAINKDATPDSGFAMVINYQKGQPWYAWRLYSIINRVLINDGNNEIDMKKGWEYGKVFKFTVAVRKGFASFYLNDKLYRRCFMQLIENDKPLWIGKSSDFCKERPEMPMIVLSAKVYGADYHYLGKNESVSAEPRGHIAGRGWALDAPTITHKEWPIVMYYGDSISQGYTPYFRPQMKKNGIYDIHFCHFWHGRDTERVLKEATAAAKPDVIVFNNGLHSLSWTPEKVSDAEVKRRYAAMVDSFRAGSPKAKLIYLNTTPFTARKNAEGKVTATGDLDPVVRRLNRLAGEVMAEKGVPVIDAYAMLMPHLDWAHGDCYHWEKPAYQLLADEATRAVLKALGRDQKEAK